MRRIQVEQKQEAVDSVFGPGVSVQPSEKGEISLRYSGPAVKTMLRLSSVTSMSEVHKQLLYKSSLVSLISTAEWFLSSVMRLLLERYPQIVDLNNKTLTYEELGDLKDIESARNYIIDTYFEGLFRGGLAKWLEVLEKKVKIDSALIRSCSSDITEVFQRRNVIVHINGITNATYLDKTAGGRIAAHPLGTPLLVSLEYLLSSIDLTEAHFVVLAGQVWRKLDKTDAIRGHVLSIYAVERSWFCSTDSWAVTECVCRSVMDDQSITEYDRLRARVNYWQANKWQGRFSSVVNDVVSFDMSAKGTVFQVMKASLLDDYEAATAMLNDIFKCGSEATVDLHWPIFQDVVKSKPFMESALGVRFPVTNSRQ